MKFLFVCEDSIMISPLFAVYFNKICGINALKVKVDFCGINTTENSTFEEELLPILEEYNSQNGLKDLSPKTLTPEMVENASIILVANNEVKNKVLKTKMTTEEQIFSIAQRKNLQSFSASNSKKLNQLIKTMEKETFTFVENLLRHRYLF